MARMTIKRRVRIALSLMVLIPIFVMILAVGTTRHMDMETGPFDRPGRPMAQGEHGERMGGGPVVLACFVLLLVSTGSALSLWVSRGVVRPLERLKDAAFRIGDGDLDFSLAAEREDETGEVMAAFETMRVKLKAALERQLADERSRKELIAHVSHDLRTPLSVIRGYAEGLRDGVASAEADRSRYAEIILERARELDALIDVLFQYSKLDMGGLALRPGSGDAGEILSALRDTVAASFPRADISLVLPETKVSLCADRESLARIMNNLTDNSVKYSQKDDTRIVWNVSAHYDGTSISVSDDGPGVPVDDISRLFDPFFRCDRARTRGGSGLGLAIVKKIMESQGGTAVAGIAPSGGLEIRLSFKGAGS